MCTLIVELFVPFALLSFFVEELSGYARFGMKNALWSLHITSDAHISSVSHFSADSVCSCVDLPFSFVVGSHVWLSLKCLQTAGVCLAG